MNARCVAAIVALVFASAGLKPRATSATDVATSTTDVVQGFSPARAVQSPNAATSTTVRIGVLRGGSYEITSVPLEEYVSRVLVGEALPNSAPAAMEALAVAVRTFTQTNLGRHRGEGFDLCDQTHCQVMRTANPSSQRAAAATSGQILLFRGAPATIFYSASCGGRTEIPSAVWPGAEDPPYLPSQPDDGCGGDPAWSAEIDTRDLQRSLAAAGFKGTLRSMTIASHDTSGRVGILKLDGMTPAEISGQNLRMAVGQTLGWQYIRSTAFEMKRNRDVYRMDGHGSGHGVGMCVIGSAKLADKGESATAILQRYYPGTTIGAFARDASTRAPSVTSSGGPNAAAVPAVRAVPTPQTPGSSRSAEPAASGVQSSPSPAAAGATAGGAGAAATNRSAVDTTGVIVSLPDGDDNERDAIVALAGRERALLATALGLTPPQRLTLRIHPTTDAFARATRRAWFTPGAVVNDEIHLPPIASLRDRGVLDRTVRRQIVHVLVDGVLARRPVWVREGAALYYADGPSSDPRNSRTPCPADADLLNPVSAGALNAAYAAARACFEGQILGGRSWRDVR